MSGLAFWFVLLAGVGLDRLWLHRDAVVAALLDFVDSLITDPPPVASARTLPGPRCVRLVRDDDGPEAA